LLELPGEEALPTSTLKRSPIKESLLPCFAAGVGGVLKNNNNNNSGMKSSSLRFEKE